MNKQETNIMSTLDIHSTAPLWLRKVSMTIFAMLPLLAWYKIPFPVGLGYALVLFLSAFTIIRRDFRFNVFPPLFWLLFTYVCLMWMYNNAFALWTIIPPGGWLFFLYFLAIIAGVINFDRKLLLKYMRSIVLISVALFWVQFALKIFTGSQIFCFVPNLTGAFTYEEMSYSELANHQLGLPRPCSIFLEPSYMAYYYITYVAMFWFKEENRSVFFDRELLFIFLTLIALKSGSGMVGLAILFSVKLFLLFRNVNLSKKIFLLVVYIPVVLLGVSLYIGSELGQGIVSRSSEFSTEGSSGFTRVVGGYMMFSELDTNEQIFGITNYRDKFGIERNDGRLFFFANGVQTILLSLGYIGAILYFLFYAYLFRSTNISSRMCIIVLLVMGLLESNYLNPYMMLFTVIPCADYYHNQKLIIR